MCLGLNGGLSLILTKFHHGNIFCAGASKPVLEDCQEVVENMPATDFYERFGTAGYPRVDVDLPYVVTAQGRWTLG